MFEHKSKPLASTQVFARRMLGFFLTSFLLLSGSLLIGVMGYRTTESMSWLDALLNASMILSGMGPAANLTTDNGKLFASLYALFSGIIFISSAGLLVAPLFHRMMHSLHADIDD